MGISSRLQFPKIDIFCQISQAKFKTEATFKAEATCLIPVLNRLSIQCIDNMYRIKSREV